VLTGPPPANSAAGGIGAQVTVAEFSSGISATFDAEGYQNGGCDDGMPYAEIPQEDAGSSCLFRPEIESINGTSDTDFANYTSNIFPVIYEGLAYCEPMKVPTAAAQRRSAD
jgi:hypothetical protein